MTQAEVAAASGVSTWTIVRIEGGGIPTAMTLRLVLDAVGLLPDGTTPHPQHLR